MRTGRRPEDVQVHLDAAVLRDAIPRTYILLGRRRSRPAERHQEEQQGDDQACAVSVHDQVLCEDWPTYGVGSRDARSCFQLVECPQNAIEQILLTVSHALILGDLKLARVVGPATQDCRFLFA